MSEEDEKKKAEAAAAPAAGAPPATPETPASEAPAAAAGEESAWYDDVAAWGKKQYENLSDKTKSARDKLAAYTKENYEKFKTVDFTGNGVPEYTEVSNAIKEAPDDIKAAFNELVDAGIVKGEKIKIAAGGFMDTIGEFFSENKGGLMGGLGLLMLGSFLEIGIIPMLLMAVVGFFAGGFMNNDSGIFNSLFGDKTPAPTPAKAPSVEPSADVSVNSADISKVKVLDSEGKSLSKNADCTPALLNCHVKSADGQDLSVITGKVDEKTGRFVVSKFESLDPDQKFTATLTPDGKVASVVTFGPDGKPLPNPTLINIPEGVSNLAIASGGAVDLAPLIKTIETSFKPKKPTVEPARTPVEETPTLPAAGATPPATPAAGTSPATTEPAAPAAGGVTLSAERKEELAKFPEMRVLKSEPTSDPKKTAVVLGYTGIGKNGNAITGVLEGEITESNTGGLVGKLFGDKKRTLTLTGGTTEYVNDPQSKTSDAIKEPIEMSGISVGSDGVIRNTPRNQGIQDALSKLELPEKQTVSSQEKPADKPDLAKNFSPAEERFGEFGKLLAGIRTGNFDWNHVVDPNSSKNPDPVNGRGAVAKGAAKD